MAPASADEAPLPDDIEGTLAALDRAEGELFGAIGGSGPRPKSVQAAPLDQPERQQAYAEPSTETAPSPATAPPPPPKRELELSSEERGEASQGPCDTACRALSSMQRAAEHLCGLTGDADARCASARDRVQHADARVRDACPACVPEER